MLAQIDNFVVRNGALAKFCAMGWEHAFGCIKWAAVGFIVAFVLMRLYEASHIHDDIPRPEFKKRASRRAALVLSTFAALLSAAVWLLVQKWD